MATTNFNVQDISGRMFKPISSKRKRSYKSAKVAPAISYDEEYVAPKASYPQVPMYDRWSDDYKISMVSTTPSINITKNEDFVQVPMYERWNW